jgi:hypothetical protein
LTGRSARALLFGALVLLYALHQDLWLWDDARIVLGLPVGLTYHVIYCLGAALLLALAVRFAWPGAVDSSEERESDR